MSEIMDVNEFERICGFSYTDDALCNGGHNCCHPDTKENELVDGKEIGLCYAFSCPLAKAPSEMSLKKMGMDPELYDTSDMIEVPEYWREEKKDALCQLWEEFGDIPMDPETECMEEEFLDFPVGTHREEIWHWFDERFPGGVGELMGAEESASRYDNDHVSLKMGAWLLFKERRIHREVVLVKHGRIISGGKA